MIVVSTTSSFLPALSDSVGFTTHPSVKAFESGSMPISELLIKVNFTALDKPSTAYVFLGSDFVGVDILRSNLLPFPLTPGAHYHGYAVQEIREKFDDPGTSFWGIWSVSNVNSNASSLADTAIHATTPSHLLSSSSEEYIHSFLTCPPLLTNQTTPILPPYA